MNPRVVLNREREICAKRWVFGLIISKLLFRREGDSLEAAGALHTLRVKTIPLSKYRAHFFEPVHSCHAAHILHHGETGIQGAAISRFYLTFRLYLSYCHMTVTMKSWGRS